MRMSRSIFVGYGEVAYIAIVLKAAPYFVGRLHRIGRSNIVHVPANGLFERTAHERAHALVGPAHVLFVIDHKHHVWYAVKHR